MQFIGWIYVKYAIFTDPKDGTEPRSYIEHDEKPFLIDLVP